MAKLILGSQSPRRKEILSYFSIPFEQVTSPFDESTIAFHGNPTAYVSELSKGKAEALASRFQDEIILTADTVVYREGKVYNKPNTEEEAFQMLSELIGQWHTVFTGVTVMQNMIECTQVEATKVLFNPLTAPQIRHYLS